MMHELPRKDAVICGLGWAGSVALHELSQSGLDVVALERGRSPEPAPGLELGALEQDDLQGLRGAMMQDLSRDTITHRHLVQQDAEPMARFGAFLLGEVVGGAGITWNGINTRFLPHDFEFRSHLERAGRLKEMPPSMQISDFGVSYHEMERDYDWFEAVTGTCGATGNLNGSLRKGGNPFEGPRTREFPNPPLPDSVAGGLFRKAAEDLGYHPYPLPASNMSRDFVNPLGVKLSACVYCGFCDRFRCPVNAKGSPSSTILPALSSRRNVEIRTGARVLRVVLHKGGKRALGVEYEDAQGLLSFQPCDIVVLSAYTFTNVHLMLLSGIGQPYDPHSGEGVVGKGYGYHVRGGANIFLPDDVWTNPFIGSGALGTTIDDFNSAEFTAGSRDFFGGAMLTAECSGGRPIRRTTVPSGTRRWGSAWKKAVAASYNHIARINVCGASMADRRNYLSLDPNYKDAWGRPRLRLTFDFLENDVSLSRFMTQRSVEIARKMGARHVDALPASSPFDMKRYQGSHNTGGAAMGVKPDSSAVNRFCQSWSVPNVFVIGGSAFPQLPGKNPTASIGALARWSARSITETYIKEDRLMA